ncbi:MAG TPA: IS630 family transposase [Candidatus Limnocylindria bacterium]|nr:IS630 family transposase [Candidatus Limnocylindria bacterium]
MRKGRPKSFEIKLSDHERETLVEISRSRSLAHGLVRRAKMLLLSDEGLGNTDIAARFEVSIPTVAHWRQRFKDHGLAGLYDSPRPGRPRTHEEDEIAALLRKCLQGKPEQATQWSVRSLAGETGFSKSSVQRYLSLFGAQPHRSKGFKLSNDTLFIEKVHDIVGLYLHPPDKALVLCVDEKSQIQALERTQPLLPMGLGYVEGVTHDYVRHGTTTLFAALNVQSGEIISQCRRRHRHQEFLAFLRHLDQSVPAELDLHLIVDNYSTHKHPQVRAWLAARPRYHVHYTPTYSSWLNQVERWFGLITQRAIRRGSFSSVKELVGRIKAFVEHYNRNPKPFVWTATSESILDKIGRLTKLICGTPH